MRSSTVLSVIFLGLPLLAGCNSDTSTTDGSPDSQTARDATASVDSSVPDRGSKPDALKSAGQACQAGTECASGTCTPAEIAFEGKRSQTAAYNVPMASVGTLKTQGILCYDASGPTLPFPPSTVAYVIIRSPNPGADPYIFGSSKLKIVVESVQSPNWADSPKGAPAAETYAIFNMGMKTVAPG